MTKFKETYKSCIKESFSKMEPATFMADLRKRNIF